jgi:hypothetical protein
LAGREKSLKKTVNVSIPPRLVRRIDGAQAARPRPAGKPARNSDRTETTMRFMMIYKPADASKMEAGVPPTQQEIAAMGEFIGEMAQAGVLLAADGLQSSHKGARVRLSAGKLTVTDGPFTESKELIAGFAIVQVKSMAEAVKWAERFLALAGDGESEIRLMHDGAAFGD